MTSAPRPTPLGPWFVALTLVSAALATIITPAQTSRTQERDLFVSVLDQAGRPVTGLAPSEFIVREDGRIREVLRARRATDPVDLTIIVDNSQASSDAMMDLRRDLETFVAAMREHGSVQIVGCADRPTVVAGSTSDGPALKKGVGRLFATPGSGAMIMEAISEATGDIVKRGAERAAILAIWAGGPEYSNVNHLNVLKDLAAAGAALHVVTVGSSAPRDLHTTEGHGREVVFDQGTRDSGGRRQNILSSMALGEVLGALREELVNQYRVTYARPESLIPPEKVEVAVRTAGRTTRGTPARTTKGPGRS